MGNTEVSVLTVNYKTVYFFYFLQTYSSWKDKFSWVNDYMPDTEKLGEFGKEVKRFGGLVTTTLPEIKFKSKVFHLTLTAR